MKGSLTSLAHDHPRYLDHGFGTHGKPFVAAALDLVAAPGERSVNRALQRARVLGFEFNKQARLARHASRDLLHDSLDSRDYRVADLDDIATISGIVNINGLRALAQAHDAAGIDALGRGCQLKMLLD